VHGGFVQVGGDDVTVLAPVAERAEEIDVGRARDAQERAEARLAELGAGRGDEEASVVREQALVQEALTRAQVRLEVAEGRAASSSTAS
jgi:F-type H+-transporting ATPase subunit epsilon